MCRKKDDQISRKGDYGHPCSCTLCCALEWPEQQCPASFFANCLHMAPDWSPSWTKAVPSRERSSWGGQVWSSGCSQAVNYGHGQKNLGTTPGSVGEVGSGRKQQLTDGVSANLMEFQSASPSWSPCWWRVITCSEEQPRTPATFKVKSVLVKEPVTVAQKLSYCTSLGFLAFKTVPKLHTMEIIPEEVMLSIPVYLNRS